jgi:hypothetical protein
MPGPWRFPARTILGGPSRIETNSGLSTGWRSFGRRGEDVKGLLLRLGAAGARMHLAGCWTVLRHALRLRIRGRAQFMAGGNCGGEGCTAEGLMLDSS